LDSHDRIAALETEVVSLTAALAARDARILDLAQLVAALMTQTTALLKEVEQLTYREAGT